MNWFLFTLNGHNEILKTKLILRKINFHWNKKWRKRPLNCFYLEIIKLIAQHPPKKELIHIWRMCGWIRINQKCVRFQKKTHLNWLFCVFTVPRHIPHFDNEFTIPSGSSFWEKNPYFHKSKTFILPFNNKFFIFHIICLICSDSQRSHAFIM